MVNLSVNVNKVATLRNSRDIDVPNVSEAVEIAILAGCQGITVHPRIDERHIRYADLPLIKAQIAGRVEYNIECDPDDFFIRLVLDNLPDQCTLVPTKPGEITSDDGFDLENRGDELRPKIQQLRDAGIRVSLFSRTDLKQIPIAKEIGADAIELYTGPYAMAGSAAARDEELEKLNAAAGLAHSLGLRVHCGHDLTLDNLPPLLALPGLVEVSIGHHLVALAVFRGLGGVIRDHVRILDGKAAEERLTGIG